MDFPQVWPGSDSVQSFTDLHYRCALYVDAAIRLQALGKEKACKDLVQLAQWEDKQSSVSGYRAIVLCRMLFEAGPGPPYRQPGTGGVAFFGGTTTSDWPLEPIILIDQVPFIIALEYDGLAGRAETAVEFVNYCIHNLPWSSTVYHRLTQPQEEESLQKLYALPVWQGHLTKNLKAFFAYQIAHP